MSTIQAIGGENIHDVVIGGKGHYHVNSIISKWKSHKEHGNNKFLIKTINDILQLPLYVDDPIILKEVLKNIWNAPNEKIFYGIVKSIELDEPIQIAKKNLFWKWKELIESLILIHLAKNNIKIDVEMKKWSDHISKNKISTSSILMYCLFNKESPFFHKYKDIPNYNYVGFCPKIPDERIKLLMQFPIDIFTTDLKIEKYINDAYDSIIKLPPKPNIHIRYNKKKFDSLDDFMTQWIDFNNKISPELEKLEEFYINMAQNIDKVNKKLEIMNKKLKIKIIKN